MVELDTRFAEADRFGGGPRDGDSGELGDGDADFDVIKRNAGPLEGDLESERRSCLNADAASTWRICVGDGKCKVPPASPGEEHVTTMGRSGRTTCFKQLAKLAKLKLKLKLTLTLSLVRNKNEAFRSENEATDELFVY